MFSTRPETWFRFGATVRTLLVVAGVLLLLGAARGRKNRDASSGVDFRVIRNALVHVGWGEIRGERIVVRWLGTGFVVDRDCRIVTARHIFDGIGDGTILLRFLDSRDPDAVRTYEAVRTHTAPGADLVLLQLTSRQVARSLCRSGVTPLRPVPAFERERLMGSPVLVGGFPLLEGEQPRDLPVVRGGLIASAELEWNEAPMLLLDLTGVPGFSGSPVILRSTGEVVGVVFGPGRTERQYDFEWATPLSREVLDRLRSIEVEP